MSDRRETNAGTYPIIEGLISPADLRKMDSARLGELAEEIRRCIRETVTNTGGHLSSNLGVVELTLALHRVFDFSSDRLLWDVGHQAYPHKLITGRLPGFSALRHEGGISGFPDPKESPYDIAKVGHSSTAISTGVGVAEGYKARNQDRKTVVVVGDGALTGGMCFEGLINAGELNGNLLVVLNDNGNFIDAPVGALHNYFDHIRTGKFYNKIRDRLMQVMKKLPFGNEIEKVAETAEAAAHRLVSHGYLFEDMGFRYFGPVDGHDQEAVENMLDRVKDLQEPVLVHVHTQKGGGWQPSEDDPLAFHGPKNFNPDTGLFNVVEGPVRDTYSKVFAEAVGELAENDERVVAVTAAMPSGTGLKSFGDKFPGRCYDVGICEQHSFAFVEGMRMAGMRPILAHYSTFAQRGYDQLFQELVVQRDLGITLSLDRAGLVGEDGETHQGLYDIAWSRCFPGTVVMAPKDGPELKAMLHWAHHQGDGDEPAAAYILRYPKEAIPDRDWGVQESPIELGRGEILRRRKGPLMIWSYGVMADRAMEAVEELGELAEDVTVVNARFAKPFDVKLLKELANDHEMVLTLEDHALQGGFGTCLAEAMADAEVSLRLKRLGVRDELVGHATRKEQLADHSLDVPGIIRHVRRLLGHDTATIRLNVG